MSNKEFVLTICKCSETDAVNWKPYEHSRKVDIISVQDAVNIIEQDIKELMEIGLLTYEQCVSEARKIFEKYVVVYG